MNKIVLIVMLGLLHTGCSRNRSTLELLNSENKNDIIQGCYEAGESREKKFVDALLQNSNDPRSTTNLKFYGMSIYQSKMYALQKIFRKAPPNPITWKPDSTNIKFYQDLSGK